MRQAVFLMIVLLVFVQANYRWFVPTCREGEGTAVDCLRSVDGDEDAERPEPFGIEDRALRQHLAQQGTLLFEQGQTADMDALIKQLNETWDLLHALEPIVDIAHQKAIRKKKAEIEKTLTVLDLGYDVTD